MLFCVCLFATINILTKQFFFNKNQAPTSLTEKILKSKFRDSEEVMIMNQKFNMVLKCTHCYFIETLYGIKFEIYIKGNIFSVYVHWVRS